MSVWAKPRRLVIAAVIVQMAIPTLAFANGVPSRFGFHMYSGRVALDVTAVTAAGERIDVEWSRYIARQRGEVDWTGILPEAVCDDLEAAAEVTVRSGGRERTMTCRR